MLAVLAQTPAIGWDELWRQVPLLAVALGVGLYLFRHIDKQNEARLAELKSASATAGTIVQAAHERVVAAKDAQIEKLIAAHDKTVAEKDARVRDLTAALDAERAEKSRLLAVIESIGGVKP